MIFFPTKGIAKSNFNKSVVNLESSQIITPGPRKNVPFKGVCPSLLKEQFFLGHPFIVPHDCRVFMNLFINFQ